MSSPKLSVAVSCFLVATLGGCAWVSGDRYYAPVTKQQWDCGHLYESAVCSYETNGLQVTVDLADHSNHITWAGIWPVFLVPVWFLTDSKSPNGGSRIGVSWNPQKSSVLKRNHNDIQLEFENGQKTTPTKIIYTNDPSNLSASRSEITVTTSDEITTSGYSPESIYFGVDNLPDKFTLVFGEVELDGKTILIPPLSVEIKDGYHYDVATL